ncbi:Aspartic peptidase [Heracleum sosnowskyi]|uniref:Aspartic peptidase n=1 Tax=Heracleum sosnowskyi TaxID=360622 RepID=A0AAD8HH98_9APIA|nr:Aspartic peptidase [Heracleum sosnowskyi]
MSPITSTSMIKCRLHYTRIDIGNPPVTFLVALDTGSDLTWVPCDCLQCAPLSASHYKALDRDLNMYDPSNSSTGKILPCTHKLCDQGPSCGDPKLPCPYNISYLTENVSSSGLLVEDVIHLISRKTDASISYVRSPVIIGCGKTQSGEYLDGIAPDGVLGLGVKEISIPSYLAKSGVIQNSFSLCFDENDSGRIFFGDQGPSTQQTTSLLPLDGKFMTYITGVEACCIGDSCLDQTSFKALIDCGTSFTHFPSDVYGVVVKEFDRQINSTKTKYEGGPWEYCYNDSSSSRLSKVPSMVLQFGKNNSFVIHTPVVDISESQGFSGFCLAIQPIETDVALIGQNYIKGYRMVFDRENLKLGWSPSDCEEMDDDGKRLPHSLPPNAAAPNLFSNLGVPQTFSGDGDAYAYAKSSVTRHTEGREVNLIYLKKLLLLLLAFHQLVCIS